MDGAIIPLKTLDDVNARISRSLEAELVSADDTFAYTSAVRGRIARELEARMFAPGEFEKYIDTIPVLLKTLSDQDRAQNAVVSNKLRKQETSTALEASKIISDALASKEVLRGIPEDITAVPDIPPELEALILEGIKETELKTSPMDFTGE